MKFLKYLTYSLALMLMVVSCEKHEITYPTDPAPLAEFQLHYFEPIANTAANYIDSVFVNDKLVANLEGGAQLLPYNGLPGYAKFYAVNPGVTNIKLFRGGNIVYNQDVNITEGKQNVIVHDMTTTPVVISNKYPYPHTSDGASSAATWGTDSVATVMFINMMYEAEGQPYEGKLQYQWQNPRTKVWEDLGNPVGFGEATDRCKILIVKSVYNSSGYCRIDYRILTEDGKVLQHLNSGGKDVNYSDYWNGYIGRSYMHFLSGMRTSKSNRVAVKQWTSL